MGTDETYPNLFPAVRKLAPEKLVNVPSVPGFRPDQNNSCRYLNQTQQISKNEKGKSRLRDRRPDRKSSAWMIASTGQQEP